MKEATHERESFVIARLCFQGRELWEQLLRLMSRPLEADAERLAKLNRAYSEHRQFCEVCR